MGLRVEGYGFRVVSENSLLFQVWFQRNAFSRNSRAAPMRATQVGSALAPPRLACGSQDIYTSFGSKSQASHMQTSATALQQGLHVSFNNSVFAAHLQSEGRYVAEDRDTPQQRQLTTLLSSKFGSRRITSGCGHSCAKVRQYSCLMMHQTHTWQALGTAEGIKPHDAIKGMA